MGDLPTLTLQVAPVTAFFLSPAQLNLLKSCYSANPRPDALMKEQLVEMTGLSPRVVRVWFQNKRCKDKKKIALKQGKVRGGTRFFFPFGGGRSLSAPSASLADKPQNKHPPPLLARAHY